MQHAEGRPFAIVAVAGLTAVLLAPAAVMAVAWGITVNLEFATAGLVACFVIATRLPTMKWPVAVVCAALIAVPPYPYWFDWSSERGRYLHFFVGFTLKTLPLAQFIVVGSVALACLAAIYFLLGRITSRSSS